MSMAHETIETTELMIETHSQVCRYVCIS